MWEVLLRQSLEHCRSTVVCPTTCHAAGLVVENWRVGRHKHMWISIGSDLRIDTRRDLDDAGAQHIPVHPLNKLPYAVLSSKKVSSPFCLFVNWISVKLHKICVVHLPVS